LRPVTTAALGICVLFLSAAPTIHAESDAWLPASLATWVDGMELFHSGRPDEGLEWILERRRERPEDPCGYFFEATAYADYDVGDLSRDERAERNRDLIEKGLKMLERPGDDAAARYCRAALYGRRSRERLERNSYLAGAYDAKRMRKQMRALIADHPEFSDCRFWLGAYDYYADVIPTYIKFFRTLLFLPKGDRERGIEQLEEASRHGVLERYNAHWTLHDAYGIEKRTSDQREVLERFRVAFPDDVSVVMQLAWDLFGERPPARERAVALHREAMEHLEGAQGSHVPRLVFRLSHSLGRLHLRDVEPQAAVDVLTTAIESARGRERDELAVAGTLARALIQTGDHAAATALFESLSQRYPDADDLSDVRQRVREFDDRTSRLDADMLPALRLVRDLKTEEAEQAFRELLERHPADPYIYFRWAEMYFTENRYVAAESLYRKIVDAGPAKPDFLMPGATLRLGQVYDVTDRRREAKSSYRRVREIAGDYDGIVRAAGFFLDNAYSKPN